VDDKRHDPVEDAENDLRELKGNNKCKQTTNNADKWVSVLTKAKFLRGL
jgi:hypothetical protein